MDSIEISEGNLQDDEWANFQQTQEPTYTTYANPAVQYENAMNQTSTFINLKEINTQVLKHHRITITHNTNISKIFNFYEKDCYITIKKRFHYGTHCIYDVVLANFTLQIHLLNLHRSSDDNDTTLSQNEIGKGGFGSVRIVKAGDNTLAVKRINFLTKAQGIDGFDIQTENAECKQIHKAIREYCLYKICSMLKVGPQVIFKSNYDLICFNNCIEFIMELCEVPSKKQHFMKEKCLSIQKLENDLLQGLKLLHSLNIIHKDIKPDNILYSQSLGRFVFTDFGIAHAVKEHSYEKTLTNFAGTPEYCSEEMKQLLSTGNGYVNLYLNDFEGFKKTVAKFQIQSSKSSNLSHNAMSYNNESAQMSYGGGSNEYIQSHTSLEQWFESEVSISPHKNSDNIYITSTHSLDAPVKYASEINFFQSLILFHLFKLNQENMDALTSMKVDQTIDRYAEQINNSTVHQEVKKYVMAVFFPSDTNSQLTLKIVELKNTARNYGPKHEETIQKIDQILAKIDVTKHEQLYSYFKNLKQSIISDPQCIQISKFQKQFMIHIYLKNYNYFIGSCIRIMRQTVKLKNKFKQQKNTEKMTPKINLQFNCKIFIFCQKLNVLTASQSNTINDLFLKLWQQQEISELLQYINQANQTHSYRHHYDFAQSPASNRIIAKMVRHAVNYLLQSNNMTIFQIIQAFNFFIYRFQWSNSEDYSFYLSFLSKITLMEQKLVDQHRKCSFKVELVKIYRKICRHEDNKELDKAYYIQQVKIITAYLRSLSDKKYYFTCAAQLIWIYFENRQYNTLCFPTAFQTLNQLQSYQCPEIQKYYALIQINKSIGDLYLQNKNFDQSLIYLRRSAQYIKQFYGSQNLSLSYYHCLFNISLAYYWKKDLTSALASYKGVLAYIERNKSSLCIEKSLIYRAIIVIRLEMGVTKQDYGELNQIIKSIVYETIFALVSLTISEYELKYYDLNISIFKFIYTSPDPHVRIFVMKTLLKYIENHLNYFMVPYDKLNYEISRIYTDELKSPSKSLLYAWNFIKIKIQDFHNVTSEDFRLMNDFVSKLMRLNSSRRGLILIKKYIFHIPPDMHEHRQKAFKLFHKFHHNLGHPFERITSQLVADEFQVLYSKNFENIYHQQTNYTIKLKNLLLKKWLARI